MSETIDLTNCTAEELEAALAKKKNAEAKAEEKKKQKYEKNRNTRVECMCIEAKRLQKELKEFKEGVHKMMDEQKEELSEYGKIRSNSLGGFHIKNDDATSRVTRIRSTEPHWDERGDKAVELIKDFLQTTVKKHNKKLYEILISFIERNSNGDLQYQKVMNLLAHEDKYTDPRWKEGLKLIKDSYEVHLRGYGYKFEEKDKHGKWQTINISFSSL